MIQIKNLFETPAASDGLRLWVGPVGLTRDLAAWCKVDRWLKEGSPHLELTEWFEEHPDGWEFFRGKHHEALVKSGSIPLLRSLSEQAVRENITLLYAESNPSENCAVSLYEFLTALMPGV